MRRSWRIAPDNDECFEQTASVAPLYASIFTIFYLFSLYFPSVSPSLLHCQRTFAPIQLYSRLNLTALPLHVSLLTYPCPRIPVHVSGNKYQYGYGGNKFGCDQELAQWHEKTGFPYSESKQSAKYSSLSGAILHDLLDC